MSESILSVLMEYLKVLASVLSVVGLAWGTARLLPSRLGSAVGDVRRAMELSGTVLLAFAGIARLGWSIQTWDGDSVAEQVSATVFYAASGLGLLLLLVGFFLAPVKSGYPQAMATSREAEHNRAPMPLDRKILYGIVNWSLLLAGLANVGVGTVASIQGATVSAAIPLTAGLVFLFAATIDRFEQLKGLGMEAKTRQLTQTIHEAQETLSSLRELAVLTGATAIDMAARVGRVGTGLTGREFHAIASGIRSKLESRGVDEAAIVRTLRPWARTACFDMAVALTSELRKGLLEKLEALRSEMRKKKSEGAAEGADVAALVGRIDTLERFLKSRFGGLNKLRLEDYPEEFLRLFDDVPELEPEIVAAHRERALQFEADMAALRDDCRLPNPERWMREMERTNP